MLHLYNTLTRRAEPFVPLVSGKVSFYSCGPTVYDFAHLGNFRSFLAADLLRRWLESPLCARMVGGSLGGSALRADVSGDGGSALRADVSGVSGSALRADVSGGGGADTRPSPLEPGALPSGGYRVRHVMNITDVGHMVDDTALDGGGDDKMEVARKRLLEDKKSGKLPAAVAERFDPNDAYAVADYYTQAFVEDALQLGLKVVEEAQQQPELLPRPTRMIPQMVQMVLDLIERGHAYLGSDGTAYFDTQSYPSYGALSGNTLDSIRSGAGGRVSQTTQAVKKHAADFMLWKPDPQHLMRWDPSQEIGRSTPLGEGYPGWHLECSVMARQLLGDVIDIHSGGEDNIFPHHECERAQSCCSTGREHFARYWFHPRFLLVEGEKMSKSKGNFFTVRELLARGFSAAALRLELIKTHYRSNANFTEQGLKDSQRQIDRWADFIARGEAAGGADHAAAQANQQYSEAQREAATRFAAAMNDDLNIAGALGAINTWVKETTGPNPADAQLMRTFDDVLGVLQLATARRHAAPPTGQAPQPRVGPSDAEIAELMAKRDQARSQKDFATADGLRDQLAAMGVEILDQPTGATWRRKATLSGR